jgi:sulfur relay (sulfurtransferase) DsrC/TusE family protein
MIERIAAVNPEVYGLNPELLSNAEAASCYYAAVADWSETLEQAIADHRRGLLTDQELYDVAFQPVVS